MNHDELIERLNNHKGFRTIFNLNTEKHTIKRSIYFQWGKKGSLRLITLPTRHKFPGTWARTREELLAKLEHSTES